MSKFPAYGRWGVFEALADEALAKSRASMEADDDKANAWFESGMRANEQDSHAALAPTLRVCRAFARAVGARDFAAVAAATAELHAAGVSILFGVGDSPDKKNSAWSLAAIGQGGLALPDRDYYLSDAADRVALREKYEAHVAKTLALAMPETYPDDAAAAAAARAVLAFETRLARSHLTPAERRDAERTYNKFASLETLPGGGSFGSFSQEKGGAEADDGAFDWAAYFAALGKPAPGEINVSCPPALSSAARAVASASGADAITADTALAYAAFHAVCRASDYLDDRFVDLDFEFFGKELDGQKELKPRWKRVVRHADALIGELVGKAYVKAHFPESAKASAEALVRGVTAAVEARLRELPWMSDATKAAALEKMAGFRVKIGYPDAWIDYATLVVGRGRVVLRQRRRREAVRARARAGAHGRPRGPRAVVHGPAAGQRVLPPDAKRDRVSGGDPAASAFRPKRGPGDQLRRHRRGDRPRDHARLRRPGPQVRRRREHERLVGGERRGGLREKSQGDGGPGGEDNRAHAGRRVRSEGARSVFVDQAGDPARWP